MTDTDTDTGVVTLKCGSSSCRARIIIPHTTMRRLSELLQFLADAGWKRVYDADDEVNKHHCPRCSF